MLVLVMLVGICGDTTRGWTITSSWQSNVRSMERKSWGRGDGCAELSVLASVRSVVRLNELILLHRTLLALCLFTCDFGHHALLLLLWI